MVGPSSPRPVEASTDSDVTVRPASSSSPRAASHTPDHKHGDTSRSRRDSHSPRRPTVSPLEPSSATSDIPKTLKRPKPRSRSSSPESLRDTTPEPSTGSADSKTSRTPTKPREKKARVTSPSPSPPPPSSRRKGKEPAADCPPSPLTNGSSDPASTRPLSPDPTNDDEAVLDGVLDEEPITHSRTNIPAAKQCEIDTVLSRLPPVGPRIEPDTNIAVDERFTQADEGFYDEGMDSHYQIFIDTKNKLRSTRRPYSRVRTPGSEAHSLVQRSVVKKTIRMRKRVPKENMVPEVSAVAPSYDFAWGPPSAAGPSSSSTP